MASETRTSAEAAYSKVSSCHHSQRRDPVLVCMLPVVLGRLPTQGGSARVQARRDPVLVCMLPVLLGRLPTQGRSARVQARRDPVLVCMLPVLLGRLPTQGGSARVQARREGSAPAMALVTPYDPASAAWTRQRPGSAVAHRLAALARRSLAVIQVKSTPAHRSMPCTWPSESNFEKEVKASVH